MFEPFIKLGSFRISDTVHVLCVHGTAVHNEFPNGSNRLEALIYEAASALNMVLLHCHMGGKVVERV